MAQIGLLARLTEPGVHIYGADAIGGEGVAFERLGLGGRRGRGPGPCASSEP
jgi:hypothetical protein